MSIYICTFIYVNIYMLTYVNRCKSLYVNLHMLKYVNVYVNLYLYVYIYVNIYVNIWIYIYNCVYTHLFIFDNICVYIHTHIYTYIIKDSYINKLWIYMEIYTYSTSTWWHQAVSETPGSFRPGKSGLMVSKRRKMIRTEQVGPPEATQQMWTYENLVVQHAGRE